MIKGIISESSMHMWQFKNGWVTNYKLADLNCWNRKNSKTAYLLTYLLTYLFITYKLAVKVEQTCGKIARFCINYNGKFDTRMSRHIAGQRGQPWQGKF